MAGEEGDTFCLTTSTKLTTSCPPQGEKVPPKFTSIPEVASYSAITAPPEKDLLKSNPVNPPPETEPGHECKI
jgi:hypothetical protein